MAHNLPILFFLFSPSTSFFFYLLVNIASATPKNCADQFCKANEPGIRFPFRLKQFQPDERCVYPGFDLSCDSQGQTTLNIFPFEDFIVESIDYMEQIIWLSDPNKCLLARLRNFTTVGSNWVVQYYKNFTLLKCPHNASSIDFLNFSSVTCLDENNYTVVAFSTNDSPQIGNYMAKYGCMDNWIVSIPSTKLDFDFDYVPPYKFGLTWTDPSCGGCDQIFQLCGFKSHSGLEIKCIAPHGHPNSGHPNTGILLFVLPPLLVAFAPLCCCMIRKIHSQGEVRQNQTDASLSTEQAPSPETITAGMDTPTIELYPKTKIGDGGITLPGDNTCSICLSDHKSGETLRTIPQCNHSFHARCIDQWLKRSATCPLCRNHQWPTKSTTTAEGDVVQ